MKRRKSKPVAAEPQAAPTVAALAAEIKARLEKLSQSPIAELAKEQRRRFEALPEDHPFKQTGRQKEALQQLAKMYVTRRQQRDDAQAKQTKRRVKLPHAAVVEAIDQMLGERGKSRRLRFKKAQADRVVKILKERHIRVADNQTKTIQRMIAERAANL